ncbi:uncharacterized protein LOC125650264 isoform X3 [Ostrea edulis]|nr:uncharacterized protein LOC125650264 isoform X3 [Ostrea edulis]
MKRSSMELRQEGSFNNVRNATQDLEDRKAYQLPATTNQHAPQSPQSSTVTNQEATTSQTSPIIHRGVITPQPSGGIQQGADASIPMESLESFMKYINVEIRDLKLMSALGNIFKDSSSQPQFPLGLYTVLLLDISSSVNKHIFKQVKTFVEQMVDDVENSAADHHLEEMIAILTFGGSCELVQRFTNDYMPVKDALESVHLGGKSPMLFGLAMAMAYCLKFGKKVKVNGHVLNPRIIIFTDGYATDSQEKESCLGADYESNAIRVQSDLFKFLPHLEKAPVTVSCVGVGECNQVFLREITEKCHGEFYPLSTQNAPKLGRYYRYQDPVTRVKNAISQGNSQRNPRDLVHEHTMGSQYIETDREEILKLLRLDIKDLPVPQPVHRDPQPPTPNIINVISIKPDISNVPVRSPSLENPVPSSPEVDLSDGELFDKYGQPQNRCHPWGARVIRGENWKWPDDQNSPGTVVAHKSEGVLVVKWDCGAHGEYPQENLFKITVPRSLKHEEIIEVGCSVKRGPDWKRGDEDGGPSTVGTVIRKHRDGSVSVVWPFGVVERYRYGERKKELEVIADAPAAAMSAERPSESIEPDTREPNQGETIVWQWIDNETTEQYTLSKDEAAKLEEVYQKKSGTVLVGYKGLQLRCQPTQMKYRDSGGKNRTGQLIRKVCTHEESETYYLIESLRSFQ